MLECHPPGDVIWRCRPRGSRNVAGTPASELRLRLEPPCHTFGVEQAGLAECGDHYLNCVLDVPCQPEARGGRTTGCWREWPGHGHDPIGEARHILDVVGIDLPPGPVRRNTEIRDLLSQPAPRVCSERDVPDPRAWLVADEFGVIVGCGEGSGPVGSADRRGRRAKASDRRSSAAMLTHCRGAAAHAAHGLLSGHRAPSTRRRDRPRTSAGS